MTWFPPMGVSLQLLTLFSLGLPNLSAQSLTSSIPLLQCVANVFTKETGHLGAPCTTNGSLSSLCFTPFVCRLNCEPVPSLTVTGDAH